MLVDSWRSYEGLLIISFETYSFVKVILANYLQA
jgi:hypothetical protein